MEVDKMDYLFIIAGSAAQATDFAHLVGIHDRTRLRYIDDTQKLRGIDGVGRILWLVGNPESRSTYYNLVGEAKIRGFTIFSESRFHRHLEMTGKSPNGNCPTTLAEVTNEAN